MNPTAGGVVLFDDGGNFYALDAANGQKLWGQELGGAIGGGEITDTVNGAWPTKIRKAKIVVLGLNSASASQ
jgi:alcohol dehydrogenase (cytochrome c)